MYRHHEASVSILRNWPKSQAFVHATGPAYADADLCILNPADWTAIRLIKTSFGSYVLDPNGPNTLGGIDNIFGIRVVTSTQMPQGTCVVMDSKVAATVWMRMGMEILSNQFGDYEFQHNAWAFRGEERFGLGVQYPKAVCVITGLSTTEADE
jgi:HK97 family phage major capsid protein